MQVKVQGSKLIIEIDVSPEALQKATPSSTGKTRIVATTSGFTTVAGLPVKLSLNVVTK